MTNVIDSICIIDTQIFVDELFSPCRAKKVLNTYILVLIPQKSHGYIALTQMYTYTTV